MLAPVAIVPETEEVLDGVQEMRKCWASTMPQQGIPPMVLTKMFGHTDVKLIMKVYYKQHDDQRMVEQASKIDFGLGLPKVG